MAVFGVNKVDGTIVECKAKPENRGKGNCPHGEHIERDEENSTPEAIRVYNERQLENYFNGNLFSFRQHEVYTAQELIQTDPANAALTPDEFQAATDQLSEAFTQDKWQLLQTFYEDFELMLDQERELHHQQEVTIQRVTSYLMADDPVASKVRAFLGPEVDLKVFADILVHEVGSMTGTSEIRNHKIRPTLTRVVVGGVANDMNRKRYVASVLFFGGRCCYCNCVMNRKVGDNAQATGEHLTPVSPSNKKSPRGVTRYGNMALACLRCNKSRENKDLDSWVKESSIIKKDEKAKTLQRIQAFRKFTLYEDYSEDQSKAITGTIGRLTELEHRLEKTGKKSPFFDTEKHEQYRDRVKIALYDLSQTLKQ